jgi:hypothetical protein
MIPSKWTFPVMKSRKRRGKLDVVKPGVNEAQERPKYDLMALRLIVGGRAVVRLADALEDQQSPPRSRGPT